MKLTDIRTRHQGNVSEAEKIETEDASHDMFKTIQDLKAEKNRKIKEAVDAINAEYDGKIKDIENQYGLLLTLSAGDKHYD